MEDNLFKQCSVPKIEQFLIAGDKRLIDIIKEFQDVEATKASPDDPTKWVPVKVLSALIQGTRARPNEVKEAKEAAETAIGKAIGSSTEHILGFVIPILLKVLVKQENILEETRDVRRTNQELKQKLDCIEKLEALETFDPKIMKEIQEGLKSIKMLEGEVHELMKCRYEDSLSLDKAEIQIAELRSTIDGLRPEDATNQNSGGNKSNEGQKPRQNGHPKTNQAPEAKKSFAKAAAKKSTQNAAKEKPTPKASENEDSAAFKSDPKDKKRRGKPAQPNQDKNPKSSGWLDHKKYLEACKIIVHGVKTPAVYNAEEESIQVQLMMDEFRIKYIGLDKGLNIDVNSDIKVIRRIKNHNDAEPEGKNSQPIEIQFRKPELASKFKAAAKYAGALNGRRPTRFGKYAIPRDPYKNKEGIEILPKPETIRMAKERPIYYFRGSIDKDTRAAHAAEKQRRIKYKLSPEYQQNIDRRNEYNSSKIILGNKASFDNKPLVTDGLNEIVRRRQEEDAAHVVKKEADKQAKAKEKADKTREEADEFFDADVVAEEAAELAKKEKNEAVLATEKKPNVFDGLTTPSSNAGTGPAVIYT